MNWTLTLYVTLRVHGVERQDKNLINKQNLLSSSAAELLCAPTFTPGFSLAKMLPGQKK